MQKNCKQSHYSPMNINTQITRRNSREDKFICLSGNGPFFTAPNARCHMRGAKMPLLTVYVSRIYVEHWISFILYFRRILLFTISLCYTTFCICSFFPTLLLIWILFVLLVFVTLLYCLQYLKSDIILGWWFAFESLLTCDIIFYIDYVSDYLHLLRMIDMKTWYRKPPLITLMRNMGYKSRYINFNLYFCPTLKKRY